jgi:hypothetical protein
VDEVYVIVTPPLMRLPLGTPIFWDEVTLYVVPLVKELESVVVFPTVVVLLYVTLLFVPGGAYVIPTTTNLGFTSPCTPVAPMVPDAPVASRKYVLSVDHSSTLVDVLGPVGHVLVVT